MNTDETDQVQHVQVVKVHCGKHDTITERVIGVFFDVYNELGFGFLESVYHEAMRFELMQAGLRVQVEMPVQVSFRGMVVGIFRADLVVNEVVLVELKAVEQINKQHEAQIINYLRATPLEIGLLMNFGPQPRFKRFILDNTLKKSRLRSVPSVSIGGKSSAAERVTR